MCKIPTDFHELDTIYNHLEVNRIKVAGFTAATRGAGVSSLIKSLAYRIQAADKNVLIVDTNCHNPDFSRPFANQYWGQVEPFDEQIEVLSLPTQAKDTQWLMKLKNDGAIAQRITELSQKYDYILIDTSAVNNINRGNLAAERILSNCQAIFMVVKAGVAKRGEVIHAMNVLQANALPLTACVYNDVVNPSLASELIRETMRLRKWVPGFADWFISKVQHSHILNITL